MPDTLDDPNKVTVTVNTDPTMPLNTYFQLFEQMADPVLLIKDDKFINCNQASLNELGYFLIYRLGIFHLNFKQMEWPPKKNL